MTSTFERTLPCLATPLLIAACLVGKTIRLNYDATLMDDGTGSLVVIFAKLILAFPLFLIGLSSRLFGDIRVMASTNSTSTPLASQPAAASSDNLSEIFHKAALLRRPNLSPELIPIILDLAECWHRTCRVQATSPHHVTRNESGTIYLAADLPLNVPPSSLRGIHFTTVSHDQGYSWDHTNHGTYAGSWTWFGAAILDERSHDRVEGKRIITNMHADASFRTHYATWDYRDEDAEIQRAFQALKAGKLIAITMCAAFPAWVNYALSATIEFDFQPVRRM